MKAISLSAPYGTLVALSERLPHSGKRFETRGRRTMYRGPLAIHQAKSLRYVGGPQGYAELCCSSPFYETLTAGGYCGPHPRQPPMGAIVAVCELAGCYPIHPFGIGPMDDGNLGPLPPEPERSFGDYTAGRWAWGLANIRALSEPIPTRGRQWLWDVDPVTEAQIAEQLARPRCPHCGMPRDVSTRISGDQVYCSDCFGWFRVAFQPGGAQLEKSDAPATWPKERRKAP